MYPQAVQASSLAVQRDVPLAPMTTFGVGGKAALFVDARTERDVVDALKLAQTSDLSLFVLGGGSNLLVPDEGFQGLVLRMSIPGIDQRGAFFDCGAGESWEALVSQSVEANCQGVECLAGIPGSVGGTPVQNVGAYGQEVAETIDSVRAFDRQTREYVELSNEQCKFRYRESIFNTTARDRYIVTKVRFALRSGGLPELRYAELWRRFEGCKPTLGEVAKVVREIRQGKGMLIVPDDPECRSAGSFFKNPVVPSAYLQRIAAAAGVDPEKVPHWPLEEALIKLPAAWLLEQAGYGRGYGKGSVQLSSKHVLALTNRGSATFADVINLQNEIVRGVERKFQISLKREPVIVE